MKFRFYITDLDQGRVLGTDFEATAQEYALCEDYFVVDTENGTWLQSQGTCEPVEEAVRGND